ncbi:hypothetical protein PVAND_010999 [Polypedilum vanderplanki]|uniref:Odorant receptor n=1 Tax=Polypedilum vanderplanki TaxID=319348 RepID=A0A9J6CJ43_POLVA|nr:hypothetical protein PVAND_010999 [Polypedilum vanderplanki]
MFKKSPSEEVHYQFEFFNKFSEIYGIRHQERPSFNPYQNPRLFLMAFLGYLEQAMAFNRIYESLNNIGEFCCLLAIESLGINVAVRYMCKIIMKDDENFRKMLENVKNFYEREEQSEQYRHILETNLKLSNFLLKALTIFFFNLCMFLHVLAFVSSWFSGRFLLVAPIYMPWIDPNTLFGYTISSSILFLFTMWIFVVFLPSEGIVIMSALQTIPMGQIFILKLKIFGDELIESKKSLKKTNFVNVKLTEPPTSTLMEQKSNLNQRSVLYQELKVKEDVESKLIDMIKNFNEYVQYLQSVFDYVQTPTFFVLSINATAIGLAALTTVYYSKAVGIVLVGFFTIQVFLPCIQGTLILKFFLLAN